MTGRVDLNCDMGESFGAYSIGADEAVFLVVREAVEKGAKLSRCRQ